MKFAIVFMLILLQQIVIAQYNDFTIVSHFDFNKDGFEDVIMKSITVNEIKQGRNVQRKLNFSVRLFYGHTDGLSGQPDSVITFNSASRFSEFAKKADLNRDNIVDSIATKDNDLSVYYGSKTGYGEQPDITFKIDIPSGTASHFFYDYNGDDVVDVMIQSHGNMPTYTRNVPVNYQMRFIPGSAGKINSGMTDIPEMRKKDMTVMRNNDFNNDGREDLFIWYTELQGITTEIWYGAVGNEPTKRFWKKWDTHLFGNDDLSFYNAGDVNGDSLQDILVLKKETGKDVRKGNASPFTAMIFAAESDRISDTTLVTRSIDQIPGKDLLIEVMSEPVGDFDGDGFDDIFVLGQGNKGIALWGGEQTVSAVDIHHDMPKQVPVNKLRMSAVGDINGDKLADVVMYNQEVMWVIYGNKGRNFSLREVSLNRRP